MTTIAQRSFAGGEIAPALHARTDHAKYATGLRTCRNMIVQKHGGARMRPGWVFVGEVKDSSSPVRLLKFVFNDAQTYVMEFGEGYIRWVQLGGRLSTAGVAAWVTATNYTVGDLVTSGGTTYYAIGDHTSGAASEPGVGASWQTSWAAQAGTIYEIPSPYLAVDLPNLQIVQSADVITITHPSYAPRQLARYGSTRWILSLIAYGPSIAKPTNLALGGGVAGTIRYWAVTAIKEGTFEESLPEIISAINRVPSAGTPTTLTWNTVGGAISYNVYRSTDGQTYGLINSAGGTPVLQSDTAWTDAFEAASSAVPGAYVPAAGQLRNPLTISASTKAYDGKYTITYLATLDAGVGSVGLTRGRVALYYSRDGEPRVLANYSTPVDPVGGVGTNGPTAVADTIDVPDNGYSALTLDLVPEVRPAGGGTATLTLDATGGPNNEVSWTSSVTSFSDAGDAADLSIGPPSQAAVFAASGDYPAAVTRYQQRTLYGGSDNQPETVYGSRIGSFAGFSKSTPLQADDAIEFEMAGDQVNAVRFLRNLGGLVAFTSGEVLFIRGDDAGILRPGEVNPKQIATDGIGTLFPLKVGDSAIYVEARMTLVRDLKPIATEGYEGTDLTVAAGHLFEGRTVVDWDYAKVPNSIVWVVLSDGAMVALTYLREHGIWAWHRHDTDGAFERVCCVPEGGEDRVYAVVRRTINGQSKRYIERMAATAMLDVDVPATNSVPARVGHFTDCIFADSVLSYNGWQTDGSEVVISGGVAWDESEVLTITATIVKFVAGDVGNAVFVTLTDDDGNETARIELTIEGFVSQYIVSARPNRTVPVGLQNVSRATWALAVDAVTGLDHLEGKAVSVFADGYVVASPNNIDGGYAAVSVAGGAIALDAPYAVIHVGLPYIADLETLDIDLPGPRTVKDRRTKVDRVLMMVEKSRGIFVGPGWGPTPDDPLANMQEAKLRDEESEFGPVALLTGDMEVTIEGHWDSNGRVLVRQVDPLPLTVLAIAPIMAA